MEATQAHLQAALVALEKRTGPHARAVAMFVRAALALARQKPIALPPDKGDLAK